MPRQRLAYAWIACIAVLVNMLAMPLSAAVPKGQAEQLLWGAFCSGSGTQLVAISLGQTEPGPANDDHSVMQHCWCCSGSAPVLALPAQAPRLLLPEQAFGIPQPLFSTLQPTPRQLWPALNPRAPPLV